MYVLLKNTHTLLAVVTISGFLLRGYWHLTSSTWVEKRLVRIAPHGIDAVFLGSGIGLVFYLDLAVFSNDWLLAKFTGLIAYIVLGMIAFRLGRSPQVRLVAFVGAVAAFAYIVGAALTKSPASWLARLLT